MESFNLAVFPEDQAIPEEALRVLWNLDDVDTRDCMARFVARSLGTWATAETSMILHDLLRDLIYKRREKELAGLHLRLVEVWDALPKLNSYAWRQAAYHLVNAGRKNDLRQLLLNFDYLAAKLTATDPNALITDYDYLADDSALRVIQSTLRLSAHVLARDTRQLAGQLTGRLLSNTSPGIRALLKQAAETKAWPWLRPLRPNLTTPGGPLICTLEGHTERIESVAVTPDGRWVAAPGFWDDMLYVWDLDSGQALRTFEIHGNRSQIHAVAVTPDGRRAVSGSENGALRVWNLESDQGLHAVRGGLHSVEAVALTPDGRHLVFPSDDTWAKLQVWDLQGGQAARTLEGHEGRVSAIAITPDGRRAVSGSSDRTLRVWDLESVQTLCELRGPISWVNAVAVTPDGRRAVSASNDSRLRVWDLEKGQPLRTLEGHLRGVEAVAVTPDGRRAVSASEDGTLRIWD